jgi:hypothetical protein
MHQHKLRKRWRRKSLAQHFDVKIRTIDGWVRRGVLPKPHYLEGSPLPFWYDDEIANHNPKQSENLET